MFFLLLVFAFGSAFPADAAGKSITIKVAQYPEKIDLVCAQGGTWALGGQTGTIAGTAACQVTGVLEARAVTRLHVMVESIPANDPARLERTLAKWQSVAWRPHTIEVGQLFYAADGKTVLGDNRSVLVGVGIFDDLAQAQSLIDRFAAVGQSSWIHEEVIERSQGRLTLRVNGQVQAVGHELVLTPQTTVKLKKVEYAVGYPWHGFADRDYRGPITFRYGIHNAIDCILASDLEAVLAGIVPSEISSNAEIGALQAQATAARGEILAKVGKRHAAEGFDTCSEQHCQVYSGETAVVPVIAQKIAPTFGYVLTDPKAAILDAVYASNCGGHGEACHLVWSGDPVPILMGVWDIDSPPSLDLSEEEQVGVFINQPPACYCNNPAVEGGDKFRWKKTITATEWQAVEKSVGIGRIKTVTDLARGFSGRIYRLTMNGEKGSKTILKELTIRKLLGTLKSSCFIATWKRDAAGFIIGADLTGAGFGHGVGMCQTGAQALAKRGWTFDRILPHYFPGSIMKKWY